MERRRNDEVTKRIDAKRNGNIPRERFRDENRTQIVKERKEK